MIMPIWVLGRLTLCGAGGTAGWCLGRKAFIGSSSGAESLPGSAEEKKRSYGLFRTGRRLLKAWQEGTDASFGIRCVSCGLQRRAEGHRGGGRTPFPGTSVVDGKRQLRPPGVRAGCHSGGTSCVSGGQAARSSPASSSSVSESYSSKLCYSSKLWVHFYSFCF